MLTTSNMINAFFLFENDTVSQEEIDEYIKKAKRKVLICLIDDNDYAKNINKSSFEKLMKSAKKEKIMIDFKNTEINIFTDLISPEELFTYADNFRFRTSFLNEKVLLKLNTNDFDIFLSDSLKLIDLMNIKKARNKTVDSKDRLLFCDTEKTNINKNTCSPENEEKIFKIIKYLSDEKFSEALFRNYNIQKTALINKSDSFNADNKYKFAPGIIILNLIEGFYKDFNKIAKIVDENINDEDFKTQILHAHLFRTINKSLYRKHFESMIFDSGSPVNLNMINNMIKFLSIKEYESLEKIYKRDVAFFYYSEANRYKNRYQYETLIPYIENKILMIAIENENKLLLNTTENEENSTINKKKRL